MILICIVLYSLGVSIFRELFSKLSSKNRNALNVHKDRDIVAVLRMKVLIVGPGEAGKFRTVKKLW
jgi:hypothetical protein